MMKYRYFEVDFLDINELLSKYPLKLRAKNEIQVISKQPRSDFWLNRRSVACILTNPNLMSDSIAK